MTESYLGLYSAARTSSLSYTALESAALGSTIDDDIETTQLMAIVFHVVVNYVTGWEVLSFPSAQQQ